VALSRSVARRLYGGCTVMPSENTSSPKGVSVEYRLIAFDLDDTLAITKTPITPRMAELLAQLLETRDVCIISGGKLGQFMAQVVANLPDRTRLAGLHLMPTCGTRYHRYVPGDGWVQVYAEDLSERERTDAIEALTDGAKALGLDESQTWGPVIENRGSQITFSALGQQAPAEAKYAWDPDGSKKEALRAYAATRLPRLEVRSGGSTSVDITGKGIDKAFGIRHLMQRTGIEMNEILFVGDRLDIGGNDRPVLDMGVPCVPVEGPEETLGIIEGLLAGPDTA
jgi:phosphomannomutase